MTRGKVSKGHAGMGEPGEVRRRTHTGEMHTGATFPVDRQAWLRDRIAAIRAGKPKRRPEAGDA